VDLLTTIIFCANNLFNICVFNSFYTLFRQLYFVFGHFQIQSWCRPWSGLRIKLRRWFDSFNSQTRFSLVIDHNCWSFFQLFHNFILLGFLSIKLFDLLIYLFKLIHRRLIKDFSSISLSILVRLHFVWDVANQLDAFVNVQCLINLRILPWIFDVCNLILQILFQYSFDKRIVLLIKLIGFTWVCL